LNPTQKLEGDLMIKVRSVEALKSYRLALEFSDGTRGIADLSRHIQRKPFLALQDDRVFRQVVVEHGAVEWPSGDVGIATEALYALVHGFPRPETLDQVRDNELQVSLRELRRIIGKTQADAADEAGLTQGALSHFENAPDHKLSALRKYVAALGGELEVTAVVGGRRIPLHGV
jgi:DNA-binding XRE family transcriptional regulator